MKPLRIVNIGSDKSLVGGKALGDAVERHRRYGSMVDSLDIVVYTNQRDGLSEFKISGNVVGHPSNSKNKLTFFFDALSIFKKINQQRKIEIVVCQDPFIFGAIGVYLKKKHGVKLQINFHGDFWRNQNWRAERWYNFLLIPLMRRSVKCADAIRVMSEGQKEKLAASGVDPRKIYVISTPVDLGFYNNARPDVVATHRQRAKDEAVIVHVGRRDAVKDYPTLFKAIVEVNQKQPVAFWQIGAGFRAHDISDILSESNLAQAALTQDALFLSPTIEPRSLVPVYHAADIVVLSSTSESFGKVLVEANACGKPVVSTATTGAKEIIRDGYNGFLVPIGDSHVLAQKIIYLLDHPTEARQMGERGRTLVAEKYGDNTQRIVDLWKQLAQ